MMDIDMAENIVRAGVSRISFSLSADTLNQKLL
jgi:hypothetical protein